jgi:deoxyhypusine synthase
MTVDELVREYGHAGFGADDLHRTIDVAAEMFGADDVTVFMGLAGAMVPGDMRRVISDLTRDGYVDAFATTGATLTHDAIEAIGGRHHHRCRKRRQHHRSELPITPRGRGCGTRPRS